MPEPSRTIPEWHRSLGIAENTLRNWVNDRGLPSVKRGVHPLLAETDLRIFLVNNPQLPAANRALRRLEADAGSRGGLISSASQRAPDRDADRAVVRELRAREATLAQELEETHRELVRVRAERNKWRVRARAHRASLRAQLELEDHADARESE